MTNGMRKVRVMSFDEILAKDSRARLDGDGDLYHRDHSHFFLKRLRFMENFVFSMSQDDYRRKSRDKNTYLHSDDFEEIEKRGKEFGNDSVYIPSWCIDWDYVDTNSPTVTVPSSVLTGNTDFDKELQRITEQMKRDAEAVLAAHGYKA